MNKRRKIEIFSAGCPVCQEAIATIKDTACPSCEISVLDMNDPSVSSRARSLGIKSIPAVVIDGQLAGCCAGRGPDIEVLKAAGLGVSIS
jgi:glutaredoxin 3